VIVLPLSIGRACVCARRGLAALGIGAASGMVAEAASIDHRIKAAGTARAVNVGVSVGKEWEARARSPKCGRCWTRCQAAKAEVAEAQVAYVAYVPAVGDEPKRSCGGDRLLPDVALPGSWFDLSWFNLSGWQ
jgi:hypothetical protein